MSRDVPYDENETCDICGKQGAFDFMGDFICEDCLNNKPKKNKERCYKKKFGGCCCECVFQFKITGHPDPHWSNVKGYVCIVHTEMGADNECQHTFYKHGFCEMFVKRACQSQRAW